MATEHVGDALESGPGPTLEEVVSEGPAGLLTGRCIKPRHVRAGSDACGALANRLDLGCRRKSANAMPYCVSSSSVSLDGRARSQLDAQYPLQTVTRILTVGSILTLSTMAAKSNLARARAKTR